MVGLGRSLALCCRDLFGSDGRVHNSTTTLCCSLVAPTRFDAPTLPPQSPRFYRFSARPRDGRLLASPWPPSREGGPSSLGEAAGPSCRPCGAVSLSPGPQFSRPRGGKPEARIPALLGMAWVTPGFPSDHQRGPAGWVTIKASRHPEAHPLVSLPPPSLTTTIIRVYIS